MWQRRDDTFAKTRYYDSSDIHYIRGDARQGVYYVGVTNDQMRADADGTLEATVTLRLGDKTKRRCLLDCNGHGKCDGRTGDCTCDAGWEGSLVNAPDTCQFEVRDLTLDVLHEGTVRIGDWACVRRADGFSDESRRRRGRGRGYFSDESAAAPRGYSAATNPPRRRRRGRKRPARARRYYRFDVGLAQAHKHKLAVEFYSKTPQAWPIALFRRGEVPRLHDGFVPNVDAFSFDAVRRPSGASRVNRDDAAKIVQSG